MKETEQHRRIAKYILINGSAKNLREISNYYKVPRPPLTKAKSELITEKWLVEDSDGTNIRWGDEKNHPEIALFKLDLIKDTFQNSSNIIDLIFSPKKRTLAENIIYQQKILDLAKPLFSKKKYQKDCKKIISLFGVKKF